MTRIIVHAGFHKTATSSLQDFMHKNRLALKPVLDYYGKSDFLSAGEKARLFGQRHFWWRRVQFRMAFRRFLTSIPDAEAIVLSRETFSGVMPGHRDIFRNLVESYADAAIPLARIIVDELKRRFGADAEISLLYTTRGKLPWMRSVYGHLLRSIHLRHDFREFCLQFTVPPDPEGDAQSIANAMAPVPVYIARLEDFADQPEGTAAAILDLLDIPDELREDLLPAQRQNQGQSFEIEQEFLNLNRSGQSKAKLKKIKDRILKKGSVL